MLSNYILFGISWQNWQFVIVELGWPDGDGVSLGDCGLYSKLCDPRGHGTGNFILILDHHFSFANKKVEGYPGLSVPYSALVWRSRKDIISATCYCNNWMQRILRKKSIYDLCALISWETCRPKLFSPSTTWFLIWYHWYSPYRSGMKWTSLLCLLSFKRTGS